jgi:hypothetical protein
VDFLTVLRLAPPSMTGSSLATGATATVGCILVIQYHCNYFSGPPANELRK